MPALERVAGRPTWLLSRAHNHAQNLLAAAFATEGLRGYHFRVLAALDQYGPASQADIGRSTGIDRSDVVATLCDLIERGLAARRADDADRRRNIVKITKRGLAVLARLDTQLDRVQQAVLAPLTPPERESLVRLLTKLGSTDDPLDVVIQSREPTRVSR
jgi:MarR family transcriptional regulator, lower aerobic nicotinate degradation pathway regulator